MKLNDVMKPYERILYYYITVMTHK